MLQAHYTASLLAHISNMYIFSTSNCCTAGARGKCNYSYAHPWWEKQSKHERKLDKQGQLEGGEYLSLFTLPCGAERAFCSCSVTVGHFHGSSCYYCTHCCGLILPRAALSASQIIITATLVLRQPVAEAQRHLIKDCFDREGVTRFITTTGQKFIFGSLFENWINRAYTFYTVDSNFAWGGGLLFCSLWGRGITMSWSMLGCYFSFQYSLTLPVDIQYSTNKITESH